MTNESTQHDPSPVAPRVGAEREQIVQALKEAVEYAEAPSASPRIMLGLSAAKVLLDLLHADAARPRAADRSEPIEPAQSDRAEPIRKDLARLLDNLYGLHARPGHVDAVLQVFQVHAPVKIPVAEAASPRPTPRERMPDENLRALAIAYTRKHPEMTAADAEFFFEFGRQLLDGPPRGLRAEAASPRSAPVEPEEHQYTEEECAELQRDFDAWKARREADRRPEWQPIASAPKDGELFLAFDWRGVFVCRWWRGDALNEPKWVDGCLPSSPTHWMPLPDPPALSSAGAASDPQERERNQEG